MRIEVGDAREVLRVFAASSVHLCVTSPPYYGVRRYVPDGSPLAVKELGRERQPDCMAWTRKETACGACYVCNLRVVFAEVKRVLRDDGTLWLVLGDTSAGTASGANPSPTSRLGSGPGRRSKQREDVTYSKRPQVAGLLPANLLGVPWRVALALQADGWVLRSCITWHKRQSCPESVDSRPAHSTEQIFLFAKRGGYYYDCWSVRQVEGGTAVSPASGEVPGAMLRDCWSLSHDVFAGPHFAPFPEEVPKRAILLGTSAKGHCERCGCGWKREIKRTGAGVGLHSGAYAREMARLGRHNMARASKFRRDVQYETVAWQSTCACGADARPAVVLDPFAGAGTTLLAAGHLGREAIGIELCHDFALLAKQRIDGELGRLYGAVQIVPPACCTEALAAS